MRMEYRAAGMAARKKAGGDTVKGSTNQLRSSVGWNKRELELELELEFITFVS